VLILYLTDGLVPLRADDGVHDEPLEGEEGDEGLVGGLLDRLKDFPKMPLDGEQRIGILAVLLHSGLVALGRPAIRIAARILQLALRILTTLPLLHLQTIANNKCENRDRNHQLKLAYLHQLHRYDIVHFIVYVQLIKRLHLIHLVNRLHHQPKAKNNQERSDCDHNVGGPLSTLDLIFVCKVLITVSGNAGIGVLC